MSKKIGEQETLKIACSRTVTVLLFRGMMRYDAGSKSQQSTLSVLNQVLSFESEFKWHPSALPAMLYQQGFLLHSIARPEFRIKNVLTCDVT